MFLELKYSFMYAPLPKPRLHLCRHQQQYKIMQGRAQDFLKGGGRFVSYIGSGQ